MSVSQKAKRRAGAAILIVAISGVVCGGLSFYPGDAGALAAVSKASQDALSLIAMRSPGARGAGALLQTKPGRTASGAGPSERVLSGIRERPAAAPLARLSDLVGAPPAADYGPPGTDAPLAALPLYAPGDTANPVDTVFGPPGAYGPEDSRPFGGGGGGGPGGGVPVSGDPGPVPQFPVLPVDGPGLGGGGTPTVNPLSPPLGPDGPTDGGGGGGGGFQPPVIPVENGGGGGPGPGGPGGPGAVPEPGTWVMMIGGFFALGAAIRRRARPHA